jgi:hypothetical protein
MALKHYLAANSYTNVSNFIYEKEIRRCTVMLEIWSDESKTISVANKAVVVDGNTKIPLLSSLKNTLKLEPSDISPDLSYLIDENAEGEFAGYSGQLTRYNPLTKLWNKWVLWDGLTVLVEDEQKYYRYKNGAWVELKDFTMDMRIWDEWLAPNVALVDGKNPIEQMYKFIKTLEQFKNCEDC